MCESRFLLSRVFRGIRHARLCLRCFRLICVARRFGCFDGPFGHYLQIFADLLGNFRRLSNERRACPRISGTQDRSVGLDDTATISPDCRFCGGHVPVFAELVWLCVCVHFLAAGVYADIVRDSWSQLRAAQYVCCFVTVVSLSACRCAVSVQFRHLIRIVCSGRVSFCNMVDWLDDERQWRSVWWGRVSDGSNGAGNVCWSRGDGLAMDRWRLRLTVCVWLTPRRRISGDHGAITFSVVETKGKRTFVFVACVVILVVVVVVVSTVFPRLLPAAVGNPRAANAPHVLAADSILVLLGVINLDLDCRRVCTRGGFRGRSLPLPVPLPSTALLPLFLWLGRLGPLGQDGVHLGVEGEGGRVPFVLGAKKVSLEALDAVAALEARAGAARPTPVHLCGDLVVDVQVADGGQHLVLDAGLAPQLQQQLRLLHAPVAAPFGVCHAGWSEVTVTTTETPAGMDSTTLKRRKSIL